MKPTTPNPSDENTTGAGNAINMSVICRILLRIVEHLDSNGGPEIPGKTDKPQSFENHKSRKVARAVKRPEQK